MEIKCYNTINGEYVTINTTETIGTTIKRSYWREDMQERRYNKRVLPLMEELDYGIGNDVSDIVIANMEVNRLQNAIKLLESRERLIIYYVYYQDLSLSEAARRIGISSSYICRLVKKIHEKLRNELME